MPKTFNALLYDSLIILWRMNEDWRDQFLYTDYFMMEDL
jgi:hypothetical protein